MRIDTLRLRNFKAFAETELTLDPRFTLLIGENGSGKTSLLDALAIACGVWLMDVPDPQIRNSQRPLYDAEIRLLPSAQQGDRQLSRPALDASVAAWGKFTSGEQLWWTREVIFGKKTYTGLNQARAIIKSQYQQAAAGDPVVLPILAYYGAGRAWLAHKDRGNKLQDSLKPGSRWSAFYDCLNERIRFNDLKHWFWNEETARGKRAGRYRPGFEVVRRAVMRCVPGADDLWFEPDVKDIVFSIGGNAQPSSNLSAGQKMMLTLVADIAVKAVTQNNFLVPADDLTAADEPLPRVLAQTPGIVLIDELDVHLHPRWQRRVAQDLQGTFPNLQFVCTTHSPQVIGEIPPHQTRGVQAQGPILPWSQSQGLDSNTVLQNMGAESQTKAVQTLLLAADAALDAGDVQTARAKLSELRQFQHGTTTDSAELQATIDTLETLADAHD